MTARSEVTNPLLDTSGFDENIDEPFRTAITFDAADFPSGSYDYRLEVTSNFAGGSRRSRFVTGRVTFPPLTRASGVRVRRKKESGS